MTSTILAGGDSSLSTVMDLLLIRFGIIAIGIAALAIVVFTIALMLKRKGKLGAAVKRIAPIAQSYADSRTSRHGTAGAVARYLDNQANRDDR